MTTAAKAREYPTAWDRFRREGGELITARIDPAGRVLVHVISFHARPGARATVELWPTVSRETDLGSVDLDAPNSWFHAEVLVRRAGFRPAEDWTTVDRLPAVRLRRDPWVSPGTVPGVS